MSGWQVRLLHKNTGLVLVQIQTLSCLAGQDVEALTSHKYAMGSSSGDSKGDGMQSPGQTGGFSLGSPVFSHSK